MYVIPTPVSMATQAAAEYAAMSARHATSAPGAGLGQVLGGARDYLSSHTLVVVLGAVTLFLLYRLVFSSPRVR